MRRKIRCLFASLMFFIALSPAFSARADGTCIYAAEPALPGAQVMFLAPDTEVDYLRINVFSDGESIVSSAVWEGSFARVALLRPLREGECLRILADGNDAYGRPFSVDRTLRVSRAGAFGELLSAFSARWQKLAGAAVFPDANAIHEYLPLRDLLSLFPEIRIPSPGEILLPDDILTPYEVAVLNGDGKLYCLSRTEDGGRYRFREVNRNTLGDVREIELRYRAPFGTDYIAVTYVCLPEDPARPKRITISLPLSEGRSAFYTAERSGDGWKCRLIAEKSASPDGIILSETERRDLE